MQYNLKYLMTISFVAFASAISIKVPDGVGIDVHYFPSVKKTFSSNEDACDSHKLNEFLKTYAGMLKISPKTLQNNISDHKKRQGFQPDSGNSDDTFKDDHESPQSVFDIAFGLLKFQTKDGSGCKYYNVRMRGLSVETSNFELSYEKVEFQKDKAYLRITVEPWEYFSDLSAFVKEFIIPKYPGKKLEIPEVILINSYSGTMNIYRNVFVEENGFIFNRGGRKVVQKLKNFTIRSDLALQELLNNVYLKQMKIYGQDEYRIDEIKILRSSGEYEAYRNVIFQTNDLRNEDCKLKGKVSASKPIRIVRLKIVSDESDLSVEEYVLTKIANQSKYQGQEIEIDNLLLTRPNDIPESTIVEQNSPDAGKSVCTKSVKFIPSKYSEQINSQSSTPLETRATGTVTHAGIMNICSTRQFEEAAHNQRLTETQMDDNQSLRTTRWLYPTHSNIHLFDTQEYNFTSFVPKQKVPTHFSEYGPLYSNNLEHETQISEMDDNQSLRTTKRLYPTHSNIHLFDTQEYDFTSFVPKQEVPTLFSENGPLNSNNLKHETQISEMDDNQSLRTTWIGKPTHTSINPLQIEFNDRTSQQSYQIHRYLNDSVQQDDGPRIAPLKQNCIHRIDQNGIASNEEGFLEIIE